MINTKNTLSRRLNNLVTNSANQCSHGKCYDTQYQYSGSIYHVRCARTWGSINLSREIHEISTSVLVTRQM